MSNGESSGILAPRANAYGGNEVECRRFVEAVKGISRSGASFLALASWQAAISVSCNSSAHESGCAKMPA
jgi:hypothetical protein